MSTCQHFNPENYFHSVQGKLIHKDQCVKCFAEPQDQNGVDVCLKCFSGGCADGQNHSLQHYKQTNHPLVLNIKMIKKQVHQNNNEEEKNQQIDKIAIGKPGGANQDQPEQYDTIYVVKCLECNIELDASQINSLVQSILKSDSSFTQSNLVAWELEINPCEHTLMIDQQNVQVNKQNLDHCSSCDLSSNLWLCLTCGLLGCGRKYFDGSGGNNHAIEHFKQTGHAVAVKQGTITPEGNASIHCYACDDEVQDPCLSDHLKKFGIKIDNLQKTEKTVLEMTLDLNLNLSLSKAMEQNRILKQVFGPGFTGLKNLGNTCYINSVLQVLFSIPEFAQIYFKEGQIHLNSCKKNPSDCFVCQFSKVAYGLLDGKYSIKQEVENKDNKTVEYVQNGIKIHNFKTLVGKGHTEFTSQRQQDASEYLQHLLSQIQKSQKSEGQKDLTQIFNFNLASRMKCLKCGGVKISNESTQEIKINCPYIKQDTETNEYPVEFLDMLKEMQQGEILEINCPNCGPKSQFLRKYHFKDYPKYLIVQVQRFVLENWVPQKIQAYINIPNENIDLDSFKMPDLQQDEFELQEQLIDPVQSVNQDALMNLQNMGFGQNRCVRALQANNNNLEQALNWLFEKTEDASLDAPLQQQKQQNKGNFSEENVGMIMSMGFTVKQAEIALSKTDDNVERAIDYLFNHPDIENEGMDVEINQSNDNVNANTSSQFELQGAIVHLGKSIHCGHYVSYSKKDNQWIYFNDEKVALTEEPLLGKAYILIFKQNDK